MKTINLRDYYPFYTQDEFVEVSEEIVEILDEAERLERNYIRRTYYNKAHYSLDVEDGIEAEAITCYNDMPERIFDLMERHCRLCRALNSLPDTQGRRIEAYYILGMSQREIAKAEGVNERNVRLSIKKGLAAMKKYLQNF